MRSPSCDARHLPSPPDPGAPILHFIYPCIKPSFFFASPRQVSTIRGGGQSGIAVRTMGGLLIVCSFPKFASAQYMILPNADQIALFRRVKRS